MHAANEHRGTDNIVRRLLGDRHRRCGGEVASPQLWRAEYVPTNQYGGGEEVILKTLKTNMSSAYRYYTREDGLCQTNGYFSLNLREKCLDSIDRLLQLSDGMRVGWVGCGDGREMLSMALRYKNVSFHGYDINEAAIRIATRVLGATGLTNVSLHNCDFMTISEEFTHVYSTAIAGPELYAHLANSCTIRICVLGGMLMGETYMKETVRLSGSGEQRQLVSFSC